MFDRFKNFFRHNEKKEVPEKSPERERYIEYLQIQHPKIWESLLRAAKDGLVHIDKEADSVTATNRLLLTYPDLHDILNIISEEWYKDKAIEAGEHQFRDLLSQLK